jgi:Zn-dependent protease
MPNTFFPLTREGQSALDIARRIAEQNQQPSVDSLMLLLALLQSSNSQVEAVLKSLNVKVENFRARLSATIKLEAQQAVTGSGMNRNGTNLSVESEAILSESLAETKHHGLDAIDGCILLLGMLRSPDSRAGQFLAQYGVTAEEVRERIKTIKETPLPKKPAFALPKTLARGLRNGVSPVFIGLVLFTAAMAGFMWFGIGNNPRVFMFAFIIGGWIISVALHEFGHAITAFWGGDESVEHKGYLTLNPLKYTHPIISIVIPVVMLILGGIGFPGGAVYINIYALRKPNYRSLVSAAGPMANILCIFLLALPFGNIPFSYFFSTAPLEFLTGIAFLALLQITAVLLNLLPIPGLDGFGILEPFLPREIVEFSAFLRPFGFLILFTLLSVDSPISHFFWRNVWSAADLISPNLAYYANEGVKIFLRL